MGFPILEPRLGHPDRRGRDPGLVGRVVIDDGQLFIVESMIDVEVQLRRRYLDYEIRCGIASVAYRSLNALRDVGDVTGFE